MKQEEGGGKQEEKKEKVRAARGGKGQRRLKGWQGSPLHTLLLQIQHMT